MLFSNPHTYGKGKTMRRIVAGILLLLIFLLPVQNVLSTPVVSVAHAQGAGAGTNPTFCSEVSTCLTSIVYLFAVYIPTNFAYAAGYLFNAALQLALNSGSYALNFLSLGWTIVRDIANLTFIFILIYIAYIIIMRAESSGTMRMLAWVVAMALLINFSFFITRTVIDAGNILSVQFYNAINIPNSIPSPLSTQQCPPTCIKDLTGGIMDAVKVQGILGDKSFGAFLTSSESGLETFAKNVLVQTLVFISVGIFLSLLGFVFLIVGIKFIVRIVILWITIIASPLAFAAHALPNNKKVMGYYQMWQDNLIQSAFYPAVFLFLFFIMNLFLQALAGGKGLIPDIFNSIAQISTGSASATQAGIGVIANIGVRMGLVIVLLYFAMKASDGFSAMGSGMANSLTSWAGGAVSGVASRAARAGFATTAWTGRQTVGRGANALSRNEWVQNKAANSIWGRPIKATLEGAAKGSYDVRGVPGLQSGLNLINNSAPGKQLGLKMNLGKASTDNIRKQAERRAKNVEERGKALVGGPVEIAQAQEQYERFKRDHVGGAAGFENQKRSLELAKLMHEDLVKEASNDKERAAAMKDLEQIKVGLRPYTEDGKTKIDRLNKERKERFAKRIGESNWANLGPLELPLTGPSRGSLLGAAKVRGGKSAHDKLIEAAEEVRKEHEAEHAAEHADDHKDDEKKEDKIHTPKTEGKKSDEKKGGGDEKPHGPTNHAMSFKGVQAAAQHYGDNEAASEEILEKIKRLDLRMRNVQENTSIQGTQIGSVQQSLDTLGKTVQRQQSSTPTSPTTYGNNEAGKGAMRPTTDTKIVGGASEGGGRRMPADRGGQGVQGRVNELSDSIVNQSTPTPPPPQTPPPSDNQQKPPTV